MNNQDLKDYFVEYFGRLYFSAQMAKEDAKTKIDSRNKDPEFLEGKIFGIYIFFATLNETAKKYNIDIEALGLNDIDHEKLISN